MAIITGLDLETTGLDHAAGHRIVEVAMLSYDVGTRTLVDRYVQRIDPERPIDPKAQAVHGITYAMLAACPKWDAIGPLVSRRLLSSEHIVIHNKGFDEPFLRGELSRIGLPFGSAEITCTMENGRWATMDGKSPKLQELCFSLGVEYNASLAHAAEYDVDRMMECFWRGLDRGFYAHPFIAPAVA